MKPLLRHLQPRLHQDKITEAIFLAEAGDGEFVDTEILTLRAHLLNIEMENNIHLLWGDIEIFENKIVKKVDKMLKTNIYPNFLEIGKNKKIKIVIDCDVITEDTIATAFKMIACIETFTEGTRLEFNRNSQFYDPPNLHTQ